MATDYYVATDGDDDDPGTLAEPWATMVYADTQVVAGDTVHYRAGTYNEGEIELMTAGANGSPITHRNYLTEAVIFQAGNDDIIIDITSTAVWTVLQGLELDKEGGDERALRVDGANSIILNCELHDCSRWTIADFGADDITFDGCDIYDNFNAIDRDGHGIWSEGTHDNLTVQNCTFWDIRGDGIHLQDSIGFGSTGHVIDNNTFYVNVALKLCCEGAIDSKEGSGVISNNTVYGFWGTDQTCGSSGSNGVAIICHDSSGEWTIRDNLIYDCTCAINIREGVIAHIYRNVIRDIHAADPNSFVESAINIDNGGTDVEVWNNTFVDCLSESFSISGGTVDIRNNIFDNCGDYDEDPGAVVTADYNCWWNCDSTNPGANDVNDNPDFTDRAGDDYTLQGVSPCIDEGQDVGLPFEGAAPDMGAFEFEVESGSASISPSPSVSPSVSPSISISPSASVSASPSNTPSVSVSESSSPSPSVSPSVSPSISPSASFSPSASVSPSISPSVSPSVSPSPSPISGVGGGLRRRRPLRSAIRYEVWLSDQFGTRIALLNAFERLTWSRVINGVGHAEIVMAREKFNRDLLWGLDRRLEIWRAPSGGTLSLQRIYFLRYLEQKMQGDAQRIILRGPDANDHLARRIIDADADSAGSSKSGTADDVMKEYVDENLGGSAAAGRDITGQGFSVQGDLSAAAAIDKAASRRNLLIVCQELAESSRQLGTRLFFDITHPTPSTFHFETFTGQRGADRTQETGQNPIILSPGMGNLLNPSLIQDWREEATYGYGAGQGLEDDRLVIETSDAARLAASIFNRREILFDGRSYSVQASLEDATEARLQEMRPRRQFNGELTDSFGFRFGKEWGFGDRMTAEYVGERLTVDTLATTLMVDANGRETIRARLDNADD